MRYPIAFLAACLPAFWAAGLCAAVFAGQPGVPARPPGGDSQKPIEEMSIEELRAYQAYYYASGGRDPMVMRFPTADELGNSSTGAGAEKAMTQEEMEALMERELVRLADAVKALRYDDAIKIADDVLNVVGDKSLTNYPPRIQQMEEQIRNYRNMAERLKRQQDIAREFETLNLRVNGIAWSPTDSKTVVNGRVYSAGEIMLVERSAGDLRIENIDEHGVVFQFKGMRFRLPVEIHSNPAAPPTQ